MIVSPEFHRQLWHNSYWMAAIYLIAAALFFFAPLSGIGAENEEERLAGMLTAVSINFFGFVAIIMTSAKAGMSFADDGRDRTWDFQRMSSISPWDLAMGRYLGATALWWIVAFMVLALATGFYTWWAYEHPQIGAGYYLSLMLPKVIFALLNGVLLSLFSYFMGMAEISAMRSSDSVKSGGASMGLAPLPVFVVLSLETNNGSGWNAFSFIVMPEPGMVEWWGHAFDSRVFWACSLVFAIYWVMAAIYRQAKAELQFRCTAVVWIAFNICLAIYGAGFFSGIWAGLAGMMILIALAIISIGMLHIPGAAMRMGTAWRARRWRQFFENMPAGICSPLLALVAYAVLMGYALVTGQADSLWGVYSVAAFACTGLLLMTRDYLFINAIRMGRFSPKIQQNTLFVYFVALYAVMPVLRLVFGGKYFDVVGDESVLVTVFMHMAMAWPVKALLPQVMAAGLVFAYAVRLRRLRDA